MAMLGRSTGSKNMNTTKSSATPGNTLKDVEVVAAPDDTVSSLKFSPPSMLRTFLLSGSWDNTARCWEIMNDGQSVPKAQQSMQGPILDVCWHDDGTKAFMSSCDRQVKLWDLASNQTMQVAEHGEPVKSIRWVKAPNFSALMTGSWDKTVKFWDTRQSKPIWNIDLGERCYALDAKFPVGVICIAGKGLIVYNLEAGKEFRRVDAVLKRQYRCISISKDRKGFAVGGIEGKVGIHTVEPSTAKPPNKYNFAFKCHRSDGLIQGYQNIYPVNDVVFHPTYETLATVGGDGRYSMWDMVARVRLKTSEPPADQPITCCDFNSDGRVFAYAIGYDWSRGHEFNNLQKKIQIFLRACLEDVIPKPKS